MMELNKTYCMDALEGLKLLPDNSIHCIVTSPPYYGLRDYGVKGQVGLERTPLEYIFRLTEIFNEAKRVLRTDGTLWLNIGDSYSSHKDCKTPVQSIAKGYRSEKAHYLDKEKSVANNSKMLKSLGFKNKELMGIPWRLAFSLQDEGWYLRQDIIWHKPNPMPESVKDRCTKAHEYIFLMTKASRYYYDHEIIKTPSKNPNDDRGSRANRKRKPTKLISGIRNSGVYPFANKRSVWTVPTRALKDAHFATFPEDLIEPCILAGCPKGVIVLDIFHGSGTTGRVANKNNRNYIGFELNPEYIAIEEKLK